MESIHSIKAVARRTGLSPHVIRIWERRYEAVKPKRTDTNRRTYSESEIERLLLLRQVVKAGHSIGHVASVSTERLRELALQLGSTTQEKDAVLEKNVAPSDLAAQVVEECLQVVGQLDAVTLERLLNQSALKLGNTTFLHQVIAPLVERIGDGWQNGSLRVSHEHLATAVIRSFLSHFTPPYALSDSAPKLLVTTPAGQLHELGAILAAVTANNLGWQVLYMGPSLPVEEIVSVAIQSQVRAVALSLVYPEDDPHLPMELKRLRRLMPAPVAILVGGRAAPAYGEVLKELGVPVLKNLAELTEALQEIRAASRQKT